MTDEQRRGVGCIVGRMQQDFRDATLNALHLAFAEQASARWFVTTDDRLLKRAAAERQRLRVEVVPPDQVPLPMKHEDV